MELLNTLPDTSERQQHELEFQIALGSALSAIKGWAAPEVEQAYNRARELCQQVGETPQLPQVMWGLWFFYHVQGEFRIALEQAESLLILAQHQQDSALRLLAHTALGADSFHLGALVRAQAHLNQGLTLYDPQQHRPHILLYGLEPGVQCQAYTRPLWCLGYPGRHAELRGDRAGQGVAASLQPSVCPPLDGDGPSVPTRG